MKRSAFIRSLLLGSALLSLITLLWTTFTDVRPTEPTFLIVLVTVSLFLLAVSAREKDDETSFRLSAPRTLFSWGLASVLLLVTITGTVRSWYVIGLLLLMVLFPVFSVLPNRKNR